MKPDQVTALDWDKNGGLMPAIVQDARSGQVLMFAYMNREALRMTLADLRLEQRIDALDQRFAEMLVRVAGANELVAMAAVACLVPGRRAAKLDPAEILRDC